MTTNDTDDNLVARAFNNPKGVVMSARKVRNTPAVDIEIVEDAVETVATAPARKYFSHANCTHARKGEAGKAARATCRRDIRAWLAAEAAFLAEGVDIAV